MIESILGEALASLPPGRYEIPVRGASMLPLLREGDLLSVAVPARAVRLGDILLIRHGTLTFAHRCAGRFGGRILTKGDAHAGLDGWATTGRDIIGTATAVRPGSGAAERSLDSPAARVIAWLLGISGLATGTLFALARRLDAIVGASGEGGPFRTAVAGLNGLLVSALARMIR